MIRGILLAYISLSLFLSQANLPLFTHICHGMGRSWTALVKPPKACCGKLKRKVPAQHCRKISSDCTVALDQTPCCEDHIRYVSLSVQLIQQVVKALEKTNLSYAIAASSLCDFGFSVPFAVDKTVQDHGPPHKPTGRDLLIAHRLLLC